jgi:hypothetical protein
MVAVLGFEPSQYPDPGIPRLIRPPMHHTSHGLELGSGPGNRTPMTRLTAARSTFELDRNNLVRPVRIELTPSV